MLKVMEKEIDLAASPILLEDDFSNPFLSENWDLEHSTGEWWVEDGWLTGRHRGNSGGLLYSKKGYPGNVLLDFEARTVPPCDNDLNFTWCSEGWDYHANDAGIGYIAGLNGWWEKKAGIEHYPECKMRSTTTLFTLVPGQTYHIQAGSIDGLCFIFVDGKLVIEASDPDPIDSNRFNRVGFGTYASFIQYRNFKLRQISWKPVVMEYTVEF
ncbi:LamG domain-containing protein [Massiliimalia timonensis]|uniref:hypothetical protein n=1 Tax=Massiliimalia timonensis TaxID=1987501 RepID=UPI0018A0D18B|nr:hypothetical protein [Massiliimalia timonensis]